MTAKSISEQIDAIREATARASVSREAAAEFLSSAGIIRNSVSDGRTVSRSAKSGAFVTRAEAVSPKSGRWATKHTTVARYKNTKKTK